MEQVCTHQNLLMSSYTRFPAGQIDFQLNLGAIDMELESSFTLCYGLDYTINEETS